MFNSKTRKRVQELECLVKDKQETIDNLVSVIRRANKALSIQSNSYLWPTLDFETYICTLESAQKERVEEQKIRAVVEQILIEKSPKAPVSGCQTGTYDYSPSYKE